MSKVASDCLHRYYSTYCVTPVLFSYIQPAWFRRIFLLTHSFPMHPFSTLWKHEKTLPFSDVFRVYKKGALGKNGPIAFMVLFRIVSLYNFLSLCLLVSIGALSPLLFPLIFMVHPCFHLLVMYQHCPYNWNYFANKISRF